MEITESILLIISIVAMVVVMLASTIPLIPGPMLVWAIGLAAAFLTNFARVTPFALLIMTLLMIAGMTAPYWLPFWGVRMNGVSCLSAVGSIVGGLVGTFLIPIPLIGTMIGLVIGALIFEFVQIGEVRRAVRAGGVAFKMYLIGLLVDFAFSLSMIIVFVISVWTTG